MGKKKNQAAAKGKANEADKIQKPPKEIDNEAGFFGHAIAPGRSLLWPNIDEDFCLQLNSAALGVDAKPGRSTLYVTYKKTKIALCSLTPGATDQFTLTHIFTPGEPVEFKCEGTNSIHLTGLIEIQDEETGDNDGYDGYGAGGEGSDVDDDDIDYAAFAAGDSDEEEETASDDTADDKEDENEEDRFEVLEERMHNEEPEDAKTKAEKAAEKIIEEGKKAESKKRAKAEEEAAKPAKKAKTEEAAKPAKKAKATRVNKGVTIDEKAEGKGKPIAKGAAVRLLYTGKLENGKVFDSNQNRKDPLKFRHGSGEVVKGMDFGIEGMKKGGKRTITIPAKLGYGKRGAPPAIPGNATLIFDVELI